MTGQDLWKETWFTAYREERMRNVLPYWSMIIPHGILDVDTLAVDVRVRI